MDNKRKALIAGTIVLVLASIGTGLGLAGGSDDQPLQGTALERASKAALDYVGGGTVVETETGDDGSSYEVEVRREDGTLIEVNLDGDFHVLDSERDDDAREGETEDDDHSTDD